MAGFRTLMGMADLTLKALFPARLRIEGQDYEGAGVGGSALNQYLEGGRAEQGTRYFRVEKSLLPARPACGTIVEWTDATGPVTKFTLMEVPDRPHETSWVLVCEPLER